MKNSESKLQKLQKIFFEIFETLKFRAETQSKNFQKFIFFLNFYRNLFSLQDQISNFKISPFFQTISMKIQKIRFSLQDPKIKIFKFFFSLFKNDDITAIKPFFIIK